jgi:hypothetical protein
MAGINNIIGAYNINPKRVSSKLSFEIGQVFAAKIVSANEMNKELILKLLDGWQFAAKLETSLEYIPDGLAKYQVEGFKDGKLQIKLVNNKEENQELNKSSLEDLLSENNIDVDKEDYNLLKKMIKHDMPLTKENISKVKTLVDFREKLFKNQDEADAFIFKYLNSKQIDASSPKGKEISSSLRGFFKELTNISEDELLTMLENDIDVSEDNIKSFVKIFRGESSIYKEVKEASDKLNQQSNVDNSLVLKDETKSESSKSSSSNVSIEGIIEEELGKSNVTTEEKAMYKDIKKLMTNEVSKTSEENLGEEVLKQIPHKEIETEQGISKDKLDLSKNKNALEAQVKEQLSSKTEELKSIIKSLLNEDNKPDSDSLTKVLSTIKENINDFKVFNSVSNQYYYMDMPVNVNQGDYQCKLLIKDDRKSGKKIDSKNVSMVVSVKTVKIGVVDAYIKVREKNMNVDIKCEEDWVKILTAGKDIILKDLSKLGYNVHFGVEKKEVEANLSNCREFFEDGGLGSINTRV